MNKCLTIKTRKYSLFFRELLNHYENKEGVYVKINKVIYRSSSFAELLNDWVKNKNIRKTMDFQLVDNGEIVCMFHDEPLEIYYSFKYKYFIDLLAKRKIVRFEISHIQNIPKAQIIRQTNKGGGV